MKNQLHIFLEYLNCCVLFISKKKCISISIGFHPPFPGTQLKHVLYILCLIVNIKYVVPGKKFNSWVKELFFPLKPSHHNNKIKL